MQYFKPGDETDTTQAETEWDNETDIEEKEVDKEVLPTKKAGGTGTDNHEFYRSEVEIGQD
eukprot:8299721-Ditylum_brightwellii.AAC.4